MDPVESLGRLVLSLGAIVGVLLLVRHWAQRTRGGMGPGAGVRVLAKTTLTRTSLIAVVETDGRRFLIGAADQGVRLLGELDADGVGEDLAAHGSAASMATTQTTPRTAPTTGAHFASPMDGGTLHNTDRPWTGLLDRLRTMTVRTHVDRPIRVPLR